MSADAATIAVYDARAADYAARFGAARPDRSLRAFMEALPNGARVLDLGCGPGTASVALRAGGFVPVPVDASPAMVAMANARHDIGARLGTFDDVTEVAAFHCVWANFALLHAARRDLPRHLSALHRSLKPGGLLHIAMKIGTGEARDGIGRFYTYVTRAELARLLTAAGFTLIATEEGEETGLAGTLDPFIVMRAGA